MSLLNNTHPRTIFLLILFISILLYFGNLGGAPIYILDEAKNAECAREMYANKNWIVPYFNGALRTDKPPLHYWFMSLGYWIFGVNEFAARFFSALFGIGTVLALYFFTKRWQGIQIALLSALIFLSALVLSLEMHYAVPDPYLIFFLSTALFCIFHFLSADARIFLYLFYILIGLAVLTKGPVAIALPALIVFLYLLLTRRFTFREIWRLNPLAGLLIILLIAFPWYYAVHNATNGEWTRGFFLEHNLNRFTKIKEGHGGFFLITLAFVILGVLPFSVYIFQAIPKAWKSNRNAFVLFALITTLVFVIFFTISKTKLPNYTMPCYPFLVILLGYFLQQFPNKDLKPLRLPIWILLVITLAIPVTLWFAIKLEPQISDMQWYSLLFIVMPVFTVVALFYLYKNDFGKFFLSLSGGFMLTSAIFLYIVFPHVYHRSPVSQSLGLIKNDSRVIAYKEFNPGYIFYLQRSIPVIETKEQLDSALAASPSLILLTQEREVADLENAGMRKVYEGKNIFETPVTKVYQK